VCRLCGAVDDACPHPPDEKIKFYLLDTSQTFSNDDFDELTENDTEDTGESQGTDGEANAPKGCINCGYGRELSKCVIPMRFPANGSAAPLVSSLFTPCPMMEQNTMEKHEVEIMEEFNLNRRNRDWTPVIANGRKMLIFSDSRQEAAFFGPYMQITHNQMVFNRMMINILRARKSSIRIAEWKNIANAKLSQIGDARDRNKLAVLLKQLRPGEGFLNEIINDYTPRSHRIYLSIFHLIDSTASSISGLEGIGIGAIYSDLTGILDLPGFSQKQVLALAQLILRYIRLNEAFYPSPEENINPYSSSDAYFKSHPQKILLINKDDDPKGEKVIRLISRQKKPTRLQTMVHSCIVRFKDIEPAKVSWNEVDEVISKISNEFINNELVPDIKGIGYQLDINKLQIMPAEQGNAVFREPIPGGLPRFKSCKKCGRLSWIDLAGLCNYPGCFGELESPAHTFQMSPDNHYRNFFLNETEIPALRAVEHTAQLDKTSAAKDFQEEFKRGRLNLLSCSTTFEMGVDLGDLSTIFMKNVPPGISNYVQRAGRAGRREGISPFVLTYCRSLPHDQYYFNKYEILVKGEVTPPAIVLENEKILTRHFNAVILSDFLKEYKDIFSADKSRYTGDPLVCRLFEDTDKFKTVLNQQFPNIVGSPCDFLCDHWLPGKYESYRNKLKEIFLHENSFLTGPFFNENVEKFITTTPFINDESYGLKTGIEKRYTGEISYYEQEKEKYKPENSKGEAESYHRLEALIRQTREEQLISHLCSRGFLPSYAFPTNVVPLEILSDESAKNSLDLKRSLDRAIIEYAPGSKVAA
ncbi:MAG: hypothetical protein MUF15_23800, partial [Acidobacteria bacterium]|nr:hypothetical protein [Acidobacteriota bacterium]